MATEKVKIEKVMATPILHVKEPPTTNRRIGSAVYGLVFSILWITLVFLQIQEWGGFSIAQVLLVLIAIAFPFIMYFLAGGVNFYLCEEGIGFPVRRGHFYPWTAISELTIDDGQKKFKFKTPRGYIQLSTKMHFDEAKEILLKHIVPKADFK